MHLFHRHKFYISSVIVKKNHKECHFPSFIFTVTKKFKLKSKKKTSVPEAKTWKNLAQFVPWFIDKHCYNNRCDSFVFIKQTEINHFECTIAYSPEDVLNVGFSSQINACVFKKYVWYFHRISIIYCYKWKNNECKYIFHETISTLNLISVYFHFYLKEFSRWKLNINSYFLRKKVHLCYHKKYSLLLSMFIIH